MQYLCMTMQRSILLPKRCRRCAINFVLGASNIRLRLCYLVFGSTCRALQNALCFLRTAESKQSLAFYEPAIRRNAQTTIGNGQRARVFRQIEERFGFRPNEVGEIGLLMREALILIVSACLEQSSPIAIS